MYLTILGLTVTVTKELSYPVEQKAKSINLRGTLHPIPPPPRHVVSCYQGWWVAETRQRLKYLNLISIRTVENNKTGQEILV